MMLDRMEGNAELKTSVHQMLASLRKNTIWFYFLTF